MYMMITLDKNKGVVYNISNHEINQVYLLFTREKEKVREPLKTSRTFLLG